MEIKKIISYECDENCYLLTDGKAGILIDPGFSKDDILSKCENLDIEYILLTHCHFDHVKSFEEIKKATGAKTVSSEKCSENLQDKIKNVSYLFGEEKEFSVVDITLSDKDVLQTSFCNIKCILTPGHTDCSASFSVEKNIFTGDTLFKTSVGRWDLPTGSFADLEKSIRERIFTLPDDFSVYPGHGEKTSVGFEKKNNPYIK